MNHPTAFAPVSVPRLFRVIADQIKLKIQAGEFDVGARLPSERDLAEALQVSRPTVREALIALEIEGFVDVRVGAGIFVSASWGKARESQLRAHVASAGSEGEVGPFDLMEARLMLEPQIAGLAASHATAEQREEIRLAASRLHEASKPGDADREFHLAIARATGNTALPMMVRDLWALHDNSAIFSRLDEHIATESVWKLAQSEHDEIVRAILAANRVEAEEKMRKHLTSIHDRLKKDLQ